MDAIEAMAGRLREAQASIAGWAREALQANKGEVLYLQMRQLAEGKASSGADLRPRYSEDPYFQSRAQMLWYRAMKRTIRPYVSPLRPRSDDAPNLFINGKFWDELDVFYTADAMTVDGGTPYAKGIVSKYGIASFGLSEESQAEIYANIVKPYILRKLTQLL